MAPDTPELTPDATPDTPDTIPDAIPEVMLDKYPMVLDFFFSSFPPPVLVPVPLPVAPVVPVAPPVVPVAVFFLSSDFLLDMDIMLLYVEL
jgi:hypothetical protein